MIVGMFPNSYFRTSGDEGPRTRIGLSFLFLCSCLRTSSLCTINYLLIQPPTPGLYFNKIQCFCFDEQLINPEEEVDLPILFYIDPEFTTDTRMGHINDVTLSYVFFESDLCCCNKVKVC